MPDGSYATRARQQVDCFQSRNHWQLPRGRRSAQKTQQLRLGKHRSETIAGRVRLKCDGTCAETRFRLSAKWTSPFKSAGASV